MSSFSLSEVFVHVLFPQRNLAVQMDQAGFVHILLALFPELGANAEVHPPKESFSIAAAAAAVGPATPKMAHQKPIHIDRDLDVAVCADESDHEISGPGVGARLASEQ